MVELEVELLRQLAVDGFDDLPGLVEGSPDGRRQLLARIVPRHGQEANPVGSPHLGSDARTAEHLVLEHRETGVRRAAGRCLLAARPRWLARARRRGSPH